ncbi:hypothetical protein C8J57DRAFT_1716182 [Mycena rebaudengoi]|nr:hypothetical protein C8J57DRAFT_1716182 [Mycena rebaudengoi]
MAFSPLPARPFFLSSVFSLCPLTRHSGSPWAFRTWNHDSDIQWRVDRLPTKAHARPLLPKTTRPVLPSSTRLTNHVPPPHSSWIASDGVCNAWRRRPYQSGFKNDCVAGVVSSTCSAPPRSTVSGTLMPSKRNSSRQNPSYGVHCKAEESPSSRESSTAPTYAILHKRMHASSSPSSQVPQRSLRYPHVSPSRNLSFASLNHLGLDPTPPHPRHGPPPASWPLQLVVPPSLTSSPSSPASCPSHPDRQGQILALPNPTPNPSLGVSLSGWRAGRRGALVRVRRTWAVARSSNLATTAIDADVLHPKTPYLRLHITRACPSAHERAFRLDYVGSQLDFSPF